MKWMIALAALIAAADQMIKTLIRWQPQGAVLFSMPPFFQITHCINTGAAFSLMSGSPILVLLLSVALLLALCIAMLRCFHLTRPARLALALILGGGMGNLIDRLLYGAVTDYIRLLFIRFPVFNLADIGITCGVAALALLTLLGRLEESGGENDEGTERAS